ncbi:cyclic nucleotide-gated ion channel 20 [Spatholobus suberectus]|nr:cyclic nucleotide-gated ion channel 20 [Spatholobus suberectus]
MPRFTFKWLHCDTVNSSWGVLRILPPSNRVVNMADFEKDEVPILSDVHPKLSNEPVDSKFPRLVPRTRSVSISIPATLIEPNERDNITNLVGYTGPLRSQRKTPFNQMSGPLWLHQFKRVNQCLRDACAKAHFGDECTKFIDCGHGLAEKYNVIWTNNSNANACFTEDGFPYGIYLKAVNLTADHNVITRYVYSSFWGFQSLSADSRFDL